MTTTARITPYANGFGPAAVPRLAARRPPADQPRRAFVAQIMGLPISVHVRGPEAHSGPVAKCVERAFDQLRADDELFSPYRPDSAVSRIQRGELSVHEAGERIRRVAALCDVAQARTDGAFSAWRPDGDGVLRFDPSGLVKGWAVEQAFDRITEELNQHDVLICAGGDVVCGCQRADTPDWVVGVEDPTDRTRTLMQIPLRQGAVATSGVAARGDHIVDPRTGQPNRDLLSATVVGPSLTWADVYATAAMVKGDAAADWVAGLPGHAGLFVDTSGATRVISA